MQKSSNLTSSINPGKPGHVAGPVRGRPIITLHDVSKSYESKGTVTSDTPFALSGISLEVLDQEFVSIIGPSGCGKSTLLKIIAGLDVQTSGTVVTPKDPSKTKTEISMVFQSGALLPWLTVYDNVAFGLRARAHPGRDIESKTEKYLELVGLMDLSRKFPRDLSGGQRQRIGLARALAVEPKVLLMDEPFSSLDPKTSHELHLDILKIWKNSNLTIVMVSHLIEEAVSMADRVVLMKSGKIEEIFPIDLPYPRREQTIPYSELLLKIRTRFFA